VNDGSEIAEQGGHFERRRTGRSQLHAVDPELFFEQPRALPGEVTVAGQIVERHRLRDVVQLFARDERFVERNSLFHSAPLRPRLRRKAASYSMLAHRPDV